MSVSPVPFPSSPRAAALGEGLDTLDKQIMAALRADGRRPWRDIARNVGASESTVARRARALMDLGLLSMTIAIDPQRCGFGYPVIAHLTCEFGHAAAVARDLAARPDVRFVSLVAGTYDIVAELIVASSDHLARVLIEDLPRVRGIARTTTSTVLRTFTLGHDWSEAVLGDWLEPAPSDDVVSAEPVDLDDLDRTLIALLQADCRMSYPKLAALAGVSESVARRRVESMIASGAVRAVALIDPRALGYEISLFASLRADLGQLERVAEEVSQIPSIGYLAATSGSGDLLAEVFLPNETDLYPFYAVTLGSVTGLLGVDLAIEVRAVKRGFVVMADASASSEVAG